MWTKADTARKPYILICLLKWHLPPSVKLRNDIMLFALVVTALLATSIEGSTQLCVWLRPLWEALSEVRWVTMTERDQNAAVIDLLYYCTGSVTSCLAIPCLVQASETISLRLRPACQRPACTRVSPPPLTWADKHMYVNGAVPLGSE